MVFSSKYYSVQRWLPRILSQVFSRIISVISAKTRIWSVAQVGLCFERVKKRLRKSWFKMKIIFFDIASEVSAIHLLASLRVAIWLNTKTDLVILRQRCHPCPLSISWGHFRQRAGHGAERLGQWASHCRGHGQWGSFYTHLPSQLHPTPGPSQPTVN